MSFKLENGGRCVEKIVQQIFHVVFLNNALSPKLFVLVNKCVVLAFLKPNFKFSVSYQIFWLPVHFSYTRNVES